jgi:hypothetical protein
MMNPLRSIFDQIRESGGEIWLDGNQVRLRFPEQPTFQFLQVLKQLKADILYHLQLEEKMKKKGWQVLSQFEAYEYRLTVKHSIFIFEEDGSWSVWRATWHKKPSPIKEKTIGECLRLSEAFQIGNEYIQWFFGHRGSA